MTQYVKLIMRSDHPDAPLGHEYRTTQPTGDHVSTWVYPCTEETLATAMRDARRQLARLRVAGYEARIIIVRAGRKSRRSRK